MTAAEQLGYRQGYLYKTAEDSLALAAQNAAAENVGRKFIKGVYRQDLRPIADSKQVVDEYRKRSDDFDNAEMNAERANYTRGDAVAKGHELGTTYANHNFPVSAATAGELGTEYGIRQVAPKLVQQYAPRLIAGAGAAGLLNAALPAMAIYGTLRNGWQLQGYTNYDKTQRAYGQIYGTGEQQRFNPAVRQQLGVEAVGDVVTHPIKAVADQIRQPDLDNITPEVIRNPALANPGRAWYDATAQGQAPGTLQARYQTPTPSPNRQYGDVVRRGALRNAFSGAKDVLQTYFTGK